MMPLHIIAGFGPKDLMLFSYIPAVVILLIASVILVVLKRRQRSRPYVLAILATPLLVPIWYLYDAFIAKQVDKAQAVIFYGFGVVVAIFALAASPIIPSEDAAVTIMALLAVVSAVLSSAIGVTFRNK